MKYKILKKIIAFIKNKKGSEDKGAGVAMSIIAVVVIGFIVINAMTGFFTDRLFPAVFDKILGALSLTP